MADEFNQVKIRRSEIRERMNEIAGIDDLQKPLSKKKKSFVPNIKSLRFVNGRQRSQAKMMRNKQRKLSRILTQKAKSLPS